MCEIHFKWLEKGDYEDCFKIRKEVFIKEQNISYEDEYDGIDDQCEHIVGYVNNTAVATGRIVIKNNKYYLGRIAVLKEYRGKGYATKLIKEMIEYLNKQKINEIYLSAQIYAKRLYQNIGFVEFGEIYLDCNIEHINMVYRR